MAEYMLDFLEKEEQIDPELVRGIEEFRDKHKLRGEMEKRVPHPRFKYYGKEIWEEAVAALLCGKNLLLAGGKATGKMSLRKISLWPFKGLRGIFPFTSIWTHPVL